MGIAERKEREKQQRREQILNAAEIIFTSKGFDHATMDEVAEAAELSKGTLYLYFRSKEEIHYGITQRGIDRLHEEMIQRVDESKDAIENILIMARVFIDFLESDSSLAASILFFQACEIGSLNIDQEEIRKNFMENSPIQLLSNYITKGMEQGRIRDDLPVEMISHTLWSQLMGVIQVIRNKKELFELIGISRDAILDSHFKIVLDGLKT